MIKPNAILMSSLTLAAMLGSSVAFAAVSSVSGKINGHGCAHHGESCPISRLDPHLALESDFVLQKADGDYYFMTNLPRSAKLRYALKDVTVTGEIDDRHRNIRVKEFQVDGKTVWSQKMQDEEYKRLYSEGAYSF